MEIQHLNQDMYIVLGLLGLTIFLFISELLRVDLVGMLVMVLLALTGVLPASEALRGFSSNAVISIVAVMIISAGLNRSGVMNIAANLIIQIVGTGERRILAGVSIAVATVSSFIPNIGAAALFLPATLRISHRLHIPGSYLLMPMAFCAIIGGCLTLVGSSPLIMLNDLLEDWWNSGGHGSTPFPPFGLLDVAPIGSALLVSAILYFILFGRWLLPRRWDKNSEGGMDHRLLEIYGEEVGHGYELTVPPGFTAATLGDLHIRPQYHITVVGVAHESGFKKVPAPMASTVISPGDVLWVMGSEENILQMCSELGWRIRPGFEVFAADNSPEECGVMEGVVVHHSMLTSRTMAEMHFRSMFQLNPLAIVRGDRIIMEDINVTKLQQGDAILLQGRWERFRLLQEKMDLLLVGDMVGEEFHPEKAKWALFFLLLALVLALGFHVQLAIAMLTGALGMIVTQVIHADRAYAAVDWRTVFLLAGLMPLGAAFQSTGTAAWIADNALHLAGQPGPLMLLAIIAVLASFFSLVASNVGAMVLMVPLAANLSESTGGDPRLAGLVVAVAVSNTFILPTNQVNALILRPGKYRTMDFVRVGTGMTVIYMVVLLVCLKYLYGVH